MARQIGVHEVYLVKENNGVIVKAVKFVDDYRPKLNIDRRYATIDSMGGCIWYNDCKSFSTKAEGNEFYTELKNQGLVMTNKDKYEAFVRHCADMTY